MKILGVALTLTFSLMFSLPTHAGECKEVVVSAHPEYPPYHWRDGKEIRGASIDLTRKIFQELGVEFKAVSFGPWKRVLSHAKASNMDMIVGLKKTNERSAFLDFTKSPILPNPFAVFVVENKKFDFNSWHDLTNLVGGKNAGDRYGGKFDSFADRFLKLEISYSTESNFKKLLIGRIDYFIHGRYVGLAHTAALSDKSNIVPLEININNGFIHSGFTKRSACKKHLDYVSKRYQEMIESGEAEQALHNNILKWKNFSRNRKE